MTLRFEPAEATPDDLLTSRQRQQALSTELTRVREAAVAWRNGLAALLAGLVGFGLVRGRSDISTLAGRWPLVVGLLLLLSLLAGAAAALTLMRSAHGLPSVASAGSLRSGTADSHAEALSAARALKKGIALTGLCTLFLVTAVAATWYGPSREKPVLRITTPSGDRCGTLLRSRDGDLRLSGGKGEVMLEPGEVLAVRPGTRCPAEP